MISKRQMMEVTLLLFQNLFKVKEVSRSGYPVVRFIYRVICLKNNLVSSIQQKSIPSFNTFQEISSGDNIGSVGATGKPLLYSGGNTYIPIHSFDDATRKLARQKSRQSGFESDTEIGRNKKAGEKIENGILWFRSRAQKRLPKKLKWIMEDVASAVKVKLSHYVTSMT